MTERSDVTSLRGVSKARPEHEHATHKDTSCFHTGLVAEIRDPKSPFASALPFEDEGEPDRLPLALPFLLPVVALFRAPRAESALLEELRERLVAMPLTSLSVSSVGSRLTNSFCSNCTTT